MRVAPSPYVGAVSSDSPLSTLFANLTIPLRRGGLLALLLAATIGCWEEIKYEPSPQSVRSRREAAEPASQETAGEIAESAVSPPAEATPLTSTLPTSEPPLTEPPLDLTDHAPSKPEPIPSEAPAAAPPEATASQRLLLWQAAGKWSLAAAMSAKQLPAERYEPTLAEAAEAADELGLTLPPLPQTVGDQSPEAAAIDALSGAPTAAFAAAVAERYGHAAASLTELAVRSNLLLLTYSPRRGNVAEQAKQFAAVAEASGLPRDAWAPLAQLLDAGADYVDVRTAIFALHRQAENVLVEPAS